MSKASRPIVEPGQLCWLLRQHDSAVTELVKAVNFGRRGTKGKKADLVRSNRAIFRAVLGRSPTPLELEHCESK